MTLPSINTNFRWLVRSTLARAGQHVGIWAHGLDTIDLGNMPTASTSDLAVVFEITGKQIGLQVVHSSLREPVEIGELLRGGMAVIVLEVKNNPSELASQTTGSSLLLTSVTRSTFTGFAYQDRKTSTVQLSRRELGQLLTRPDVAVLAVKPLQDCDSISANPVFAQTRQLKVVEHHDYHDHISPLSRFFGLLRMERKDVGLIVIFALASSILSLATPLAVESLVNVISWGIYVQPLIVLTLILLGGLVLSGMFSVLQYVVVEIIQRRQFVRIVCDLAHRFPVSNRQQLKAKHPRELANRVLEIMAIQKATAVLLLDGTNIIILSTVSMLLLGFYHSYLLSFVIVILVSMTLVLWALGRGGVGTAIEESKIKYRMVHWLQDVLDSPTAFRINGGDLLAINRANSIATDYVEARKRHFSVLLRQIIFAASLQAIALTSVLGIGGWLVIQGDLTLGQLVAAELVVALVVGSFSKAGKSIEKFYDLMASMDKVGHLLDLKADANAALDIVSDGPLPLSWSDVEFDCGTKIFPVSAGAIEPGTLTAILIPEPMPRVAETLAGLLPPYQGSIKVSQINVAEMSVAVNQGRQLSLAGRAEIFLGSVASNIDLGRSFVSLTAVRETIKNVNLWPDVSAIPTGINTTLQSTGYPLTPVQMSKLMIARSLVASPRLFIVDGLLDSMTTTDQQLLLELFRSLKSQCTVIVITQNKEIADNCDRQIDWRQA